MRVERDGGKSEGFLGFPTGIEHRLCQQIALSKEPNQGLYFSFLLIETEHLNFAVENTFDEPQLNQSGEMFTNP